MNKVTKHETDNEIVFRRWFPEIDEKIFTNFKLRDIKIRVKILANEKETAEFIYRKGKI